MDGTAAVGPRRVLVTGATGFAGSHLIEALLTEGGCSVWGLSRHGTWPSGCEHLAGPVPLYSCDLCDRAVVADVLRQSQPDEIYHLAGYARVGQSFHEPEDAWRDNLTATRSLYDAVLQWGDRPRILYVGSGLVYGGSQTPGHALDERCLLLPDSPYAASKAAADLLSYQYTAHPGLDIIRARPFNHIGPRQQSGFAVPDFVRQVVDIERGRRPAVLQTGDLRPQRDLTDVRDAVAAYRLLMKHGRSGEVYNVGRGECLAIGTVLERLLELAGCKVDVRQNPALVRGAEVAAVCADVSKLRRQTNWTPRYSLDQTLMDTLAWWRSRG